jgi:hypothetical protein
VSDIVSYKINCQYNACRVDNVLKAGGYAMLPFGVNNITKNSSQSSLLYDRDPNRFPPEYML